MIGAFGANQRLNIGEIVAFAGDTRRAQCHLTISGSTSWRIGQNNTAVRTVAIDGNARVVADMNLEIGNDDLAVGDNTFHCQAETVACNRRFVPTPG